MKRPSKPELAHRAGAVLRLDASRRSALELTIDALENLCPVDALFFHGSFTRGTHDSHSDIDVIAVVATASAAKRACNRLAGQLAGQGGLRLWRYSERFPWFGRLLSLQFRDEGAVLIELGVIARRELSAFYVEPQAIIVRDWRRAVLRRKALCRQERRRTFQCSIENIEFDLVHLMDKVAASLERGNLWNAFELINLLRRLYLELWRHENDPTHELHVGRAERDVGTALSLGKFRGLEATIPELNSVSIAKAALNLASRICRLRRVRAMLGRSRLVAARRGRLRLVASG